MLGIWDSFLEWIKDFLIALVNSNLSTMFTDVNEHVSVIAAEVGKTPQGWSGSVYSMVRSLSGNVMMPIAGMILSLVLCYELISMVTSSNNLQNVDTWIFFKFALKAGIAVYLLSHTFDMTMAVFDVGQHLVSRAAGSISSSVSIDISSTIATLDAAMETMEVGELLLLAVETFFLGFAMKIMSVLIMVVLYGRMVEIYIYTSAAPIPFATMVNKEWGNIGTNYLRGLFALAFQGFFIMVCVGVYGALVQGMAVSGNLHFALFSIAAHTVVLCFSLFRTQLAGKVHFQRTVKTCHAIMAGLCTVLFRINQRT